VLIAAPSGRKEASMPHKGNKPGREKRKPKKEKIVLSKPTRDSELLQHMEQHPQSTGERRV
jgi:hypothetical protein